jgi:hypothetical protein
VARRSSNHRVARSFLTGVSPRALCTIVNPPVDTSSFQLGVPPDYDDEAEAEEEAGWQRGLRERALSYISAFRWAPPVKEILLAFGVGKVIGLFLVRFTEGLRGEGEGDTECWVVTGDLPSMYFETDARTPADALRLYAAIAEDWAEAVLTGRDLSQSYPVPVAPTKEHAQMLKGRVEFIREKFVPIAGAPDRVAAKAI